MNVLQLLTALRRRVLRAVGILLVVAFAACRGHGGGDATAPAPASSNWDEMVWDRSNWS